jgi:WXXGXW repeat (2 copies)
MCRKSALIYLFFVMAFVLIIPSSSPAQISVGLSVHIGPPALPIYAQPICPGAGYIWTPGFWSYGPEGYYWVPGTWVIAPSVGVLWTPGYWGWGGGVYLWHGGYWGPHVGFYGGINYGYGYGGVGFVGGEWRGGAYHYNTAVTNVNTTIVHNTYNTTVINNNTTVNRTSFNGGTGGTTAQPTAAEQAALREPHTPPTAEQTQHIQAASTNHALLASVNHGAPAIAATPKAGAFNGPGVVASHPAALSTNHPGSPTGAGANNGIVRNDRPPSARTNTTNTTNTSSFNSANHPNTTVNSNTIHADSVNKPPTSTTNTTNQNTTQNNSNHPNNVPPSNVHPYTSQPKPPKQSNPPKQQSHPSEHERP